MFCVGFKFQVRLPRQQLYVCRISPKTTIQQILDQVCREKGFDPNRYTLIKTGKIDLQIRLLISCNSFQDLALNFYDTKLIYEALFT